MSTKPPDINRALRDSLESEIGGTDAFHHMLAPVLTVRKTDESHDDLVALARQIEDLCPDHLASAAAALLRRKAHKITLHDLRVVTGHVRRHGASVLIRKGDPQWHAWRDHYQASKSVAVRMMDEAGCWTVPRHWPGGDQAGGTT